MSFARGNCIFWIVQIIITSLLYTYNFDGELFMRHEIEPFVSDENVLLCAYSAFQEEIYAILEIGSGDNSKIKVLLLNEEGKCWVELSQHDIGRELISIEAVSSPYEIAIVLVVDDSEDSDNRDRVTLIYRYDLESKDLVIDVEKRNFDFNDKNYLFVPHHLFCD